MRHIAVLLTLSAALGASACTYDLNPYAEGVTVPADGRTVASVSQDAGLSLATGAAPGTATGFFYDWPRRNYEQRVQAAQRRERILQQQAGAEP
jgi:hypothetical protein